MLASLRALGFSSLPRPSGPLKSRRFYFHSAILADNPCLDVQLFSIRLKTMALTNRANALAIEAAEIETVKHEGGESGRSF